VIAMPSGERVPVGPLGEALPPQEEPAPSSAPVAGAGDEAGDPAADRPEVQGPGQGVEVDGRPPHDRSTAEDGREPLTELRIRRPADRGLMGVVPVDPVAVVEAAVIRGRAAQGAWGALPASERVVRMAGLRREIGRRVDDIVDRIVAETGKPEEEALAEVLVVMRLIRHYERKAEKVLGPRRIFAWPLPGGTARVLRDPVGVVGVLSAWNYPFVLGMEAVVTALFAGNAVVLKPSEHAPFTGAILAELCDAAGLPEDLVLVVQGDGATGEALVSAGADHLHLVGSPATARAVLARAAELLLPVSLELGGKDPAVVLADADLELAARGIAFGAFYNAGQTCVSTERVFVEERVYEPFLRHLVRVTEGLRVGNAGNIDIGPMTLDAQLEKVEAQVRDAVERGARVLVGGTRADPASNIFLPTVLADVPEGSRILEEESFGPVLPVVSVRDADEAVARANLHPMGLFASVWTRDLRRGREVAVRLRAGGVSVNDTLSHWSVPGLPMGGVGESGWSRMHAEEGLLTFSRSRSLLVRRGSRRPDPWWFPYGARLRRLLRALLGWEQHRGPRGLVAMVVRLLSREIR
jgi:acyl-CoA reductase-like NAD-dependent aldehyde dehydrogenase